MQGRLDLALLAAALLLAPLAAAGEGDTVRARSPVLVEGTAAAGLEHGAVVLVSEAPATLHLTVRASRALVTHESVQHLCPAAAVPLSQCAPAPSWDGGSRDRYELEDVELVAVAPTDGPLVVSWSSGEHGHDEDEVEEDADEGARIVAKARGVSMLAADGADIPDACFGWCGWPVPLDLDGIYLEGASWELDADGTFRIEFEGAHVDVTGTDEDGESFQGTYVTGPWNRSEEANGVEYARRVGTDRLVVEFEDARLSATAESPGRAYGEMSVDVAGLTTLHDARGEVPDGDGTRKVDGADVTIPGNLTLVPVAVVDGSEGPQLVLRIASEDVVTPAETREASFPPGAAAVAVGVGSVALLGAALAYFWPYAKYAGTALVIPMYSRIGREEVLEHGKREEIFHLIRAEPGIHAHDISTRANVGWGTTVYHLKLLETHGLVVGKRNGRYKRFFATAGGAARQGDAYAALRNETTAAIARHVLAHPGCIQKDVCAALGLQPSLVTWHMNRLEEVDLVKKVRDGRTVRYYAGGSWGGLQLSFAPPVQTVTPTVVDAGAN